MVYPLEMISILSISFVVVVVVVVFFFFFFFFGKGYVVLDHFKFIQVHLAHPCLKMILDTIAFFRLNSLKGFWTIVVHPFYL